MNDDQFERGRMSWYEKMRGLDDDEHCGDCGECDVCHEMEKEDEDDSPEA